LNKKWVISSVIVDAVGFNLSIVLSFLLRFHWELPPRNFTAYLDIALFITGSQVLIFYLYGLYSWHKRNYFYPVVFNLIKAITVNTLIATTISYFSYTFAFPRTVILINWPLSVLIISTLRFIINRRFREHFRRNLLIVGRTEEAGRIYSELKKYADTTFDIKGFVTTDGGQGVDGKIGEIENFREVMDSYGVTDVVIGHGDHVIGIVDICRKLGVDIYIFPGMYELLVGKAPLTEIGGLPLLEMKRKVMEGWQGAVKRSLDLVISVVLLLILSPLFAIISMLIKFSSKGPVFYRQVRIGKDGKEFVILKFRTMFEGAEETTGATLALEDDPRITGIGRFLRKWRLDELPQLWNVLKGEMSLVGPRPERPEFVKEFSDSIPLYLERLRVRPGITGLAQVNGRYDSAPEDKLRYDLAYIYNYSLILDLKVIFLTIRVIVTGWGAR